MDRDPRTDESIAAYDEHAEAYQRAFRQKRPVADLRRFGDLAGRGSLVLDVGCGPATDLRALADLGVHPVGLDLSMGALRYARLLLPRHPLVRAPLEDPPFRPGSFGGLWMSSAVTHLPRADWRPTFAHLLTFLGRGPVHFSCYRGTADMEPVEDQVLGKVHRSQATEDEVEALLTSHGLRDVQVEVRPDPIVDRRRLWVMALGHR